MDDLPASWVSNDCVFEMGEDLVPDLTHRTDQWPVFENPPTELTTRELEERRKILLLPPLAVFV